VIEEFIMNNDWQGYSGGRIEVYRSDEHYAIDEIRFFIPTDKMEQFRKFWDFWETDKPIRIGGIDTFKKED
jgi:hypothetical protein